MKTTATLFLIALIIRLGVIFLWRFDGLYGQDAYAYFNQASAILENLPKGESLPTDFFWPNGYPLLIAFFMPWVGQTALAGQLATLLCGAALAPLAYLLSRDLWLNELRMCFRSSARTSFGRKSGPPLPDMAIRQEHLKHALGADNHGPRTMNDLIGHRAGLIAGLIIAVAGQPILSSVVIMADVPALSWATLTTWLVVRAVNFEQKRREAEELERQSDLLPITNYQYPKGTMLPITLHFLAAGAVLALAIISRWLYVLVVPALGLYTLFSIHQRRIPWWSALPAILSGAILLAPQLWLSFNKPEGLTHSFLLSWSPAHFWQRQFENTEGHFSYLLPMALFYAQPAGHPAYIFPLLGLASLWATWRLWQMKWWKPLILLIGWAAPVYIFLAGISFQNFRFGLTLYLPLVILTGFGLSDLLSRGEDNRRVTPASRPLPLHSPAVLRLVIALSLVGMLAWAYPMLDNFLTAQNQSKMIARQVEQTLPPEATLITFSLTLTLQHYTQLQTLELFYLNEDTLKTLIQSPHPLYVLLDVGNIETQWRDKTPQLNYQWLVENTTLTEIKAFPPYTLFKVAK
jgi:hypothetical protein